MGKSGVEVEGGLQAAVSCQAGAAYGPSPLGSPATWAGVLPVERGSEWQWTDGCKTRRLEKKLLLGPGEWGLVHLPPLLVHLVANTSWLVALDMAFLGHS